MMKKYKHIREATNKELEDMIEELSKNLYNKYYMHFFEVDFMTSSLNSKENDGWHKKWITIVNNRTNNEPVGIIRLSRDSNRIITELAIVVYEEHSGRKYGTKAIKEIISLCGDLGITNIIMRTSSSRLLKYYKRLSFKHVGTLKYKTKLMDGKMYDEYTLQKLLKQKEVKNERESI